MLNAIASILRERENKTMLAYFGDFWKNYVNFSGRTRRAGFWYPWLCLVIINIVLGIIDGILFQASILSGIFSLAVLIPGISLSTRRLHDIGKSGWWYLIAFIPLIGGILLIIWWAKEGDKGDNAYGPDPKAGV